MKKSSILGIACALFIGQNAFAQTSTTTVVVQEDPSLGYTFNQFKDNWFISVEGGANVYFSHADKARDFGDRFSPAASIWVGKWFSPIIGVRAGANFLSLKGCADVVNDYGVLIDDYRPGGYYKTHVNNVGPVFDVMINLTNWWCGYHPGRVYNATAYVGGGAYWTFTKEYDKNGKSEGYHDGGDKVLSLNAGLINTFRLNKHFDIYLDLRYTMMDSHYDNHLFIPRVAHDAQAYLGVTYNFNKTEWNAPLVPVVAETQDCDVVENRLQAATARVADLESQLRDCIDRPAPAAKTVKEGPMATIYYPIGVSRLTNIDRKVLAAIADVMKADTNKTYTLTGWADNYTGSDQVNDRLRQARVNGVAKCLQANGVDASQLNVTTNNANRCGDNDKYVALDRAVTIDENK